MFLKRILLIRVMFLSFLVKAAVIWRFFLSQLWQVLKPIYDEPQDLATSIFIKAVRYAVNEWAAICRYVNSGQAEIDNNTLRMFYEN